MRHIAAFYDTRRFHAAFSLPPIITPLLRSGDTLLPLRHDTPLLLSSAFAMMLRAAMTIFSQDVILLFHMLADMRPRFSSFERHVAVVEQYFLPMRYMLLPPLCLPRRLRHYAYYAIIAYAAADADYH